MLFILFKPLNLAIFTLCLAYLTEFMQYLKLIKLLGLDQNVLARLVIGSVFDPFDLLAYTIGTILVYTIDTKLINQKC